MSSLTQHRGFTLIELLVTLAVLAIVVTVAVPGFRGLAESNRMTGLTNELVAAVNFARSEAVKRGAPVSVCAANGGWGSGWSVREGTACASADLRVWDAPDAGPVIATRPANSTRITFAALGERANNVDCVHISEGDGSNDRVLLIGRSGAISVSRRDECTPSE